ncbi:MAG: trimeric autotransporter adhesin, partial [Thermoproteota archaeon]|nr:trimeric autotransporter adhesin [Thermoproteota archaeon]
MLFKSVFHKSPFKKTLTMIILASLVMAILPLSTVFAAPWTGDQTHPYLKPKWTASVSGGGEALLTAEVRSDYAGEEVFHAGGPVQPSSTAGSVRCFSGQTGNQIWITNIYGIGDTATMQMADVDNDGRLEILVALQHPSGLYILNAEDGTILWNAPGTYNGHTGYFTTGPSSTTRLGGRIDGSGVVGDTDGDGNLDIFIGIMAFEKQPTTGAIIHYEWNGSTFVERGRTQVWHPCAGGLSLGDTDNDGIPELYMNERDVYFGDGSWGRGTTSFTVWNGAADVFEKRWDIYDWGASSDIPMLADVNKDGILDVVSTNLGRGIMVLNSTDGHPLKNATGTVLKATNLATHAHYQASIFDIDGDGNLELLCADGKESESYGTQVFDLWSWKLDADIPAGYSFRGPSLGEVTGDGQMDIIIVTFDLLGNTNTGTVQIYDRNYQKLDEYGGLRHRAIGSVVQDVDRNDNGLNELLVLTQGGIIYCFDTPGLSQEKQGLPRARSEVHFFSESRMGAAEYVPFNRPYPDITSTSPSNLALGVSTSTNQLTFVIDHPLNQLMTYTVTGDFTITSGGSGGPIGDGQRTVNINGLAESALYHWQINVTDSSGHKTSKNYWFTTGPYVPNNPPVTQPDITAGNTILDDLTAYNQTTTDINEDLVTNIYNWQKNGASITNINLPFETRTNPQDEFSGLAITKDYAYNATGAVFGATWVPTGKVDGAYSFDGNDFIRFTEPTSTTTRTRYDGYGTWTSMSVECWVQAGVMSSTERLIVKKNTYDNNMSYRLDVSRTSSALAFTWRVGVPNATDSRFSVTYTLGPYSIATGVGDWHHVVATYKSGTGLRLYVDGLLVSNLLGPSYSGNIFNSNGPFEIAFNSGSDFIGLVDEVRLYPLEISPTMVNQRYLDTKDGSSSSSTISKYDTNIGDQWRCQVTPNDGLVDGIARTTVTRTIVDESNEPPSASNLAVFPASPLTADDLIPSYTYFDQEGNPEVNSIVNWYKGGVFVFSNPTLPASLTTRGDVWSYRLMPSDGFEYGAEMISGTIIIGNTAPSITSGVILPDPALDSSTLIASTSGWTDTDNDAPGYTYQWQIKDGDVYTDIPGQISQTLSTAYFGPNDWIAVKVTAFDGALYGNTLTFETPIVDSDPPTTGTPSLVSSSGSNRDDDELICTPVNTQDPDGDNVINIFNWLIGTGSGTSITNLYLPFETHSSTAASDYSGYGNNAVISGANWTSAGIVGGAYNFDGNDVIAIADSTSLGNDGTWNELTV